MYDTVDELDGYTISRKRYEPEDPRLGRHVRHDSRSLAYQVEAQDVSTLKSVRHFRAIPVLNQGQLGSCVGNAGTGAMSIGPFWAAAGKLLSATDAIFDEHFAIDLYSDCTKADPYPGTFPPTDTGSDGLSCGQVLKSRGLISGYVHATSLEAVLTMLQNGPAIAGIEWHQDSFHPDPDGRVRITGIVAGGHEINLDEIDVVNKRIWFSNSWGPGWGVRGRGYFTWDDFAILMSHAGDVIQFVPVTQPAPQPTPTPTPTPTPQPVPDKPDWAAIKAMIADAKAAIESALSKLENL